MSAHRPPKPVIAVVVLAIIGLAGWWIWSATRPVAATPTIGGMIETRTTQVSALVSAPIVDIKVEEGAVVAKDQPLVILDSRATQLQIDQANQGVAAAQAALDQARNDGTDADVASAQARLNQAQANVSLAELQLGYTVVSAPKAGIVTSVVATAGQGAAPGRTLLTISDTANTFARVYIPEPRLGEVSVGKKIQLTAAGRSYEGTVSFISANAEFTPNNVDTPDQRVKLVYEMRVDVTDTSGALKPGLPVDVSW